MAGEDLFDFGLEILDNDDFFGLPLEPLHDFNVGLEATDLSNLLDQFEESERIQKQVDLPLELPPTSPQQAPPKSPVKDQFKAVTISVPQQQQPRPQQQQQASVVLRESRTPVKKQLNSILNRRPGSTVKRKKCGISLLAKPAKKVVVGPKKGTNISPARFAMYFYQDHDYCPSPLKLIPDTSVTCNNLLTHSLLDVSMFDDESFSSFVLPKDEESLFEKVSLEFESQVVSAEGLNSLVQGSIVEEMKATKARSGLEICDFEKVVKSEFFSESKAPLIEALNVLESEAEVAVKGDQIVAEEGPKNPKSKSSSFRVRKISTRSSVSSSRSSSRSSRSRSRSQSNSSRSSSSCSTCSSCSSRSRSKSSNRSKRSRSRSISLPEKRNYSQNMERTSWMGRQSFRSRSRSQSESSDFAGSNYETCSRSRENRINPFMDRRKNEQQTETEERRIVYVGNIPEGTSKTDLRHWFGRYGAIKEVSVHFRDYGDNYAFVTFERRCDAYEAVTRGNEDKRHPRFDLSFGGRRNFCKTRYTDLDHVEKDNDSEGNVDFDSLLRSTIARLRH